MPVEYFEVSALTVGVVLTIGTFWIYVTRRRFGRAELVFCLVGALLVILPIVKHVKFKTKNTELEIDRLQRQVAQLQKSVGAVAVAQDRLLDLQQQSVQIALTAPGERQTEANEVLGQLRALDLKMAQSIQIPAAAYEMKATGGVQ